MIKKILPIIFIFTFQFSFSQNKRANIWYFGSQAGIDFNSGSAVVLNNSTMGSTEGCATMCDTSGALMFYTNGYIVADRNHMQMPNGSGLMGGSSSSQSSLIVPDPGNMNQYYIFTTASDASGGLTYSMVDMTLNSGNGDVTTLNTPLVNPVSEKLTGFQKPGSNDIWVMTHEWGTANFYAYLLTAAGLNVPVISTVGQVHSGTTANAIGYMKISPNGDKLCLAQSRNNNFELFDFDAATGVVSNPLILPANFYTYGIEFSRDGKILYAAEFQNEIFQYDLTLGSSAAILASKLLLLPTPVGSEIGSLQMAPDGKIYVCKNSSNFVGVINSPATLGQGCNYVDNGFDISPHQGIEGLPNFIQSIFTEAPANPVALFNAPNHICPGTCTDFTNLSINGQTYLWSFPGANPSVSTDVNPTNICYNTPGTYTIQLIASNAIGSDTLTLNNFITVYPNPAPQGIAQSGDTLIANQGANSYQWYYGGVLIPGATDYFYVAQGSGDYNIVATDVNGCEVEAAIFDVIAGLTTALSQGKKAMVFPNPAGEFVIISSDPGIYRGRGDAIEISIYDVLGSEVIQLQTSNFEPETKVVVQALPAGIYVVEISSQGKILRNKFVKSTCR